jgi:hypothetical protein
VPEESGRPFSRRATISCALTVNPGATHGWDGVSGGAYYDIGANSEKGGHGECDRERRAGEPVA